MATSLEAVRATEGTQLQVVSAQPVTSTREPIDWQPAVDALTGILHTVSGYLEQRWFKAIVILFAICLAFGPAQVAAWVSAVGSNGLLGILHAWWPALGALP